MPVMLYYIIFTAKWFHEEDGYPDTNNCWKVSSHRQNVPTASHS